MTDVRYRDLIQHVADDDVARLLQKDKEYGASWKRRGGVGAYMMMIRKIDRIMAIIPEPDGHPTHGFDVFAMLADESVGGSEQLLDTMRDLRGYLTLIEAEYRVRTGDRSKQPVTYDEVSEGDSQPMTHHRADALFKDQAQNSEWHHQLVHAPLPQTIQSVDEIRKISEASDPKCCCGRQLWPHTRTTDCRDYERQSARDAEANTPLEPRSEIATHGAESLLPDSEDDIPF